jgi:hypothetical protein
MPTRADMPIVIIRHVITVRSKLPRMELSAIFMFWDVFTLKKQRNPNSIWFQIMFYELYVNKDESEG